MANIGSHYENHCSRCNTTWHAIGVSGAKNGCPTCGSKYGVTRMRVRSIGNFKHPVTPALHG